MASDVRRKFLLETAVDTTQARKGLSKLGKVAAGVAVGGLFALGFAAVEGIKAFREEEQIVRAFTRTVRNLGIPVGEATRAMDRMATRAVQLGFDDAETIQGMQSFVKLTGDIGKATELTSLAWDIARSRQIPLSAAIKAAQGIYKGSARELKGYGIEGKKGMEAVAAARRVERGAAREWARNHPMQMRLGQIQDTWADLVGNFVKGNFKGVQEAVGRLGTIIQRALFGWTDGRGIRVKGLVDRVGAWGAEISAGILKAIGDVDWGTKLSETLNSALGALATGIKSGAVANVAIVGTALAGAMFAFHVFFAAARTLFSLPGWAAKSLPGIAARAVGLAFSASMFVVDLFIKAAGVVFTSGRWLLGAGAKSAGAVVGLVFRTAMFVADKFIAAAGVVFQVGKWAAGTVAGKAAQAAGAIIGISFRLGMFLTSAFVTAATALLGRIGASKVVAGAASGLGRTFGLRIAAGVLGVLTGAYFISQIANALYNAGGLGKVDEGLNNPGPDKRPLPDWRPGWWPRFALGTAGAPRGLAWVGEQGPELVRFRGGERVLSNRASRAAGGSAGTVVNITIPVNAPVAADGARAGQEIAGYLDRYFARGGRLRYMPAR